jgi:esterase/lipase superfamily enzyme
LWRPATPRPEQRNVNRNYYRWYSPRLGRDMELLVFGHAGARVLVFPTRDGRFHEYEDLRIVEALRPKIDAGHLQLYCVDSIAWETFYCFSSQPADRVRRHTAYEDYVLNEVMALMGALNPDPCTIAHGCSLGAFIAANIAFRHPHRFRKLAAFSGRYDLTLEVESFPDVFAGYRDDEVYFNTPTHYLPNLCCPSRLALLRSLDIVLAIGRDDPFAENNRQLSRILWDKGIWHALHEWDGRAHRGCSWRSMAPLYV